MSSQVLENTNVLFGGVSQQKVHALCLQAQTTMLRERHSHTKHEMAPACVPAYMGDYYVIPVSANPIADYVNIQGSCAD